MITAMQMLFAFLLGHGAANEPFAYAPPADRAACEKEVDAQDIKEFGRPFETMAVRYARIEDCLAKRGHVKK